MSLDSLNLRVGFKCTRILKSEGKFDNCDISEILIINRDKLKKSNIYK